MSQPIYPLYQPQVLQETCEGICRFDVRDQMLANRELDVLCQQVVYALRVTDREGSRML